MVSLLFAEGCEDIADEGKIITIADQAAGTGGMFLGDKRKTDFIKSNYSHAIIDPSETLTLIR